MKCGNPLPILIFIFFSIVSQAQSNLNRIDNTQEFLAKKKLISSSQGDVYVYLKPKNGDYNHLKKDLDLISFDREKGFLVQLSAEADMETILKNNDVSFIAPETKVSPLFARIDQKNKSVNLWFHSNLDIDQELYHLIDQINFEIVEIDYNQKKVEVRIGEENLSALQNFGAIRYISPAFKSPRLLMDNANSLVRANVLQNNISIGSNLSGNNIHIGVWDGGLVGRHVDLDYNLINEEKDFFSSAFSQHATHVSGIIGGRSLRAPNVLGIAPNATIHAYNFFGDVVGEIKDAFSSKKVSITNSSFAFPEFQLDCQTSGIYLPEAAELDQFTYENDSIHHVVAVGNSGFGLCEDPYSTIEIGFQGAKNNITVGWTDLNENIWVGSSRGPTIDGRLKPELVAEGAQVASTSVGNTYQSRWGSSQSSPAVAGIIGLLSEQYKKDHNSLPRADLIKAVLCTGARDLGPEGADFTYGHGLANAYFSNEILKNGNYFLSELSNGDSISFDISVPVGTEYLRATLVWTDRAAILPASTILVNDLDFKIKGPTSTWLPWVNDPMNPSAPPTRAVDNLNNTESISIINPDAGTHRLKVKGSNIPMGEQKFALAFQFGGADDLRLTNPVGGEKFLANTRYALRWDDFGLDETYDLEYSIDGGVNWEVIVTDLPASRRYHFWTTPNIVSHKALVKVKTASHEAQSEVFTIMATVASFTGTLCEGHITLNWPSVSVATAYDILQLNGEGVYDVAGTTTENSYIVSGISKGEEYWFTIVAKDDDGSARRTTAVKFVGVGGDCNFSNDIGITKLIAPLGGHKLTNSELTDSETVSIELTNFSGETISDFDVCFSINGDASICESFVGSLSPNETKDFSFSNTADFTVDGQYRISIWTNLIGDNNNENDTLKDIIVVDPNLALDLPYFEDFEGIGSSVFVSDKIALQNLPKFDFINSTTEGRLRASGPEQFALEGAGCITLDNFMGESENLNDIILNLNLSDYIDSNIYIDFSYLNQGQDSNEIDGVYFRGSDSDDWLQIYDLYGNSGATGLYKDVTALSLTKVIVDGNQSFSTSSQLKFSQYGKFDANYLSTNDGYSFDNIKVYNAGVDLRLDSLLLSSFRCSEDSFQLTLEVSNLNLVNTAVDVLVAYQVDDGEILTASIGNIDPGTTRTVVLDKYLNLLLGNYSLNVNVLYDEDLFVNNNEISNFNITINKTKIFEFDDLVNFELEESWYGGGIRSSWEWGSPNNDLIASAGEGEKSIITSLNSDYNRLENSYISSNCYDFTSIDNIVGLSFLGILDIETDFDGALLQYSSDGINWFALGTNGSGFNWFNQSSGFNYWDQDILFWQVFSNELDLAELDDKSRVIFRFRIISDEFVQEEGMAIDNFYLTSVRVDLNDTLIEEIVSNVTLEADQWSNVIAGDELGAQVFSSVNSDATIGWFNNQNCFRDKHFATRSYHFISPASDAVEKIRIALSNKEYIDLIERAAASTPSLSKIGVMGYAGINVDEKMDNNLGEFTFIDPADVEVIPYRNGYLIEFTSHATDAEYYIYYDKTDDDLSYATSFDATKKDADSAIISFEVNQLNDIALFNIDKSTDGVNFDPLTTLTPNASLSYATMDEIANFSGIVYYRLLMEYNDGSTKYGGMDSLVLKAIECESDSFNFTYTTSPENCNQSDGSITIQVNNGSRPFNYSWPSEITMENDSFITNQKEGAIILTVSDANNCVYTDTIEIQQRIPEIALEAISFVSCYGVADGFINIEILGGLEGADLQWSNGAEGESIDSLLAGNYTVTYADSNGCMLEATFGILENDSLFITVDSIIDAIDGMPVGAVYITPVGGSGIYAYTWSNGEIEEDLIGVVAGNYQLLLEDENGCMDSIEVSVGNVVGVQNSELSNFLIYPNPTHNLLNVTFIDEYVPNHLSISSLDGRQLMELNTVDFAKNKIVVDISDLDDGVYFISFRFDNHSVSQSFVKMKR